MKILLDIIIVANGISISLWIFSKAIKNIITAANDFTGYNQNEDTNRISRR